MSTSYFGVSNFLSLHAKVGGCDHTTPIQEKKEHSLDYYGKIDVYGGVAGSNTGQGTDLRLQLKHSPAYSGATTRL